MSSANEASIGITARLDGLRAELAKMGDIGGDAARDMVRALNQQIKAAEKAARDAARASKDAASASKEAADAYKRAEDAAEKFGQTGAKLAGVLELVDPRLAAASRAANDFGDLGEVAAGAAGRFGVSLTAVGAAAVPLVLVIAGVAASMKYDAEQTAADAAAKDALKTAMEGVQRVADGNVVALDDLRARVGLIAPEEAKYRRELAASRRDFEAQNEAIEKAITARKDLGGSWGAEIKALRDEQTALQAAQQERETLLAADREYSEELRRSNEFIDSRARAEKAAAEAAVAAQKALGPLNESLAAEGAQAEANARAYRTAAAAVADLEAQQRAALATDEQRIELQREAALATNARYLQERLAVAATESARETARQESDAAVRAIDARYDADQEARRAKEAADARKGAEAMAAAQIQAAEQATASTLGMVNQAGQYTQQALSAVSASLDESSQNSAAYADRLADRLAAGEQYYTAAQREELRKRADQAREQALRQFKAAQAAKSAEAVASTALAAINAIAQSPPPSPLGVIGAGIATAAGVASVAAINSVSPSFHAGAAPDEMQATLRSREAVLNPTGAQTIGNDAIRDANAGVTPQQRDIVVVQSYQHNRMVSRYKQDGLRRNDPVAQLVAAKIGAVGMEG